MTPYLKSLAETALGFFLGGVAAVAAVPGADLTSWATWRAALAAGALGVLKGVASRYVGSKDTSTLT